jgi:hypothetical protein
MENLHEAADAIAQQMLENLRLNVAEDKRRRALLHGVSDSEDVPDEKPVAQISRCCK